MENAKILIYDGSFNGYLTAIFLAFEEKIHVVDIQKSSLLQNGLFTDAKNITTQLDKAERVWNGIQNKSHIAIKNVYFSFLSEQKGIELLLYRFIRKLFFPNEMISLNFSDNNETRIYQLAKAVGKEKYSVETFTKLEVTKDGVYLGNIAPEFDVLPLISKHFCSRFQNQKWIIYGMNRKYGLYYDSSRLTKIASQNTKLHPFEIRNNQVTSSMIKEQMIA
tara:strand:- start:94226 stop:94888 length:663 start_codon:yes stop_codon:yes gene_type:complete